MYLLANLFQHSLTDWSLLKLFWHLLKNSKEEEKKNSKEDCVQETTDTGALQQVRVGLDSTLNTGKVGIYS